MEVERADWRPKRDDSRRSGPHQFFQRAVVARDPHVRLGRVGSARSFLRWLGRSIRVVRRLGQTALSTVRRLPKPARQFRWIGPQA